MNVRLPRTMMEVMLQLPHKKVRFFTKPENIETDALAQISDTASMPFVEGVAVMPDVHFGKGSTVGTVVATRGAVMPACVGVDIGCGMIAVRTSLSAESVRPHLSQIREGIERRIPTGHNKNSRVLPSVDESIEVLEAAAWNAFGNKRHMDTRAQDWRTQLGTLGGGNHFIEICTGYPWHEGHPRADYGTNGGVWIILHSGSRGIGNKVAQHWIKVAQEKARRNLYDTWLPNPDLAYLIEGTEKFDNYIRELQWCQEFARLNREEMMDRVLTELSYTVLPVPLLYSAIQSASEGQPLEVERINCHHNYTSWENFADRNLIVTRKGAIRAREGDRGLIPGSMGDRSYIVTGLGNTGSFDSAPHGAGRRMSRRKARETFTLQDVTQRMEGIEARVRESIIDEAPGAYKDIDTVMNEASTLVRPTHVLKQILSVKGD